MPGWELVAPLILALAGLLGAIGTLVKVLAEVRSMRAEQDRQATALGEVHEQAVNSHKGKANLRDDVDALRAVIEEMRDDHCETRQAVARVESTQGHLATTHEQTTRRHDRELGRIADAVERLTQSDNDHRERADTEHDRLWQAIHKHTEEHP